MIIRAMGIFLNDYLFKLNLNILSICPQLCFEMTMSRSTLSFSVEFCTHCVQKKTPS
uniref:Uncharacterized protein n=1 Tax=Anguilla anguilla TaxID=7936 RepID=A0A0E9UW02_ANGAN